MLLLWTVATSALAMPAAPLPVAARIMCLGDSITLGVGGGGYREPLANLLQQHDGGDWDYVGPMYANGGKHAGYNGWTIKQILTVAERDLSVHQPTHVLLMAGTNDFFFLGDPKSPDGPSEALLMHPLPALSFSDAALMSSRGAGGNATDGVARMTELLGLIFHTLPKSTVILSGVTHINATLCAQYSKAPWHPPNCPASMPTNIATYNDRMVAVVQGMRQAGREVWFHDPNCNRTDARACTDGDKSTWSDGDYFTYGIHFSANGYAKMAAQWHQALSPHLAPDAQ
jgi:lysophospholipase L1-like esterase